MHACKKDEEGNEENEEYLRVDLRERWTTKKKDEKNDDIGFNT